ncbi:uncharacterized protein LOC135050554 [Pseudophryne corroboree]|uniref:uncharacterized protein LOC135050554 n=1 Tax=Pseudophryne corroboree TaxID=495146 RepID=UPI0030813A44
MESPAFRIYMEFRFAISGWRNLNCGAGPTGILRTWHKWVTRGDSVAEAPDTASHHRRARPSLASPLSPVLTCSSGCAPTTPPLSCKTPGGERPGSTYCVYSGSRLVSLCTTCTLTALPPLLHSLFHPYRMASRGLPEDALLPFLSHHTSCSQLPEEVSMSELPEEVSMSESGLISFTEECNESTAALKRQVWYEMDCFSTGITSKDNARTHMIGLLPALRRKAGI